MIISKTPLRVSFLGGGTDLPTFYKKSGYGTVVSSTIDKYLYITLKKQNEIFFEKYRLNYSITESVHDVDKIKNPVIRECIKFMNIDDHLYISTIADIHSMTGLGSSSSLCVGLLNALYKFKGLKASADQLAEEASEIEINKLNLSLGKQDHYSAAFGGLNCFKFFDNEKVEVKKIDINNKIFSKLIKSSLIFWTGIQRSSEVILKEQSKNNETNKDKLIQLRDYAEKFYKDLMNGKDFPIELFGELIDKAWQIKKSLASSITTNLIDQLYNTAKKNGAFGSKICGAGGGGFMLVIADPKNHPKIIGESKKLNIEQYQVNFENIGSKTFEVS